MPEQESIAIVGASSIGLGWAIVFARAGLLVRLFDVAADTRAAAPTHIEQRLAELDTNGLLQESVADIMARVRVCGSLADAVARASWVQECIVEALDLKKAVFAELDGLVGAHTVLASSSSMIACSQWADAVPGRHRCLVVHPGNPPYLLPVAELVPAPFTSSATVDRARAMMQAVGMTPVLVQGEPEGFVFNRLQGALLREAYCLVRDGVVTAAELDQVVSGGLGRRWGVIGPFATAQLNTRGGIRRHAQVMGPAYARMGAERGQDDPWTPELVDEVARDLSARLPDDQWDEQVLRRDAALIQLERARRESPDIFTSFEILTDDS